MMRSVVPSDRTLSVTVDLPSRSLLTTSAKNASSFDDLSKERVRVAGERSGGFAMLEQIKQRQAAQIFSALAHQFTVAIVEQHAVAVGVEHTQALLHVIEGHAQLKPLLVEALFGVRL